MSEERDAEKPSVVTQAALTAQAAPLRLHKLRLPELRQMILTWTPLTIALISLAMGLYNFVMAGRTPELVLVLPDKVRIAQGGAVGPLLYIQPVFVTSGPGARTEVISGMSLRAEPLDRVGPAAEFEWREQGTWSYDPQSRELTWLYTGDAAPFLVGPQQAALLTGLFIGPVQLPFEPGRYRLTLTAQRIVEQRPLTASIEVNLAADALEYINASEGQRFMDFPTSRTR